MVHSRARRATFLPKKYIIKLVNCNCKVFLDSCSKMLILAILRRGETTTRTGRESERLMTSRERTLAVLTVKKPDRVPLNFFAGWNIGVSEKVAAHYGSGEAFCDLMHADVVTGVLPRFPFGGAENHARIMDLDQYLVLELDDPTSPAMLSTPCDEVLNMTVNEALRYHQQDKAVFCHAWGVFELSQFLYEHGGLPGTEQALLNMAAEPEKTRRMFVKLAEWTADCNE